MKMTVFERDQIQSIITRKNEELKLNEKLFFNTILRYLGRIYGDGTNKSGEVINIVETDKIHVKCNCVNRSIKNAVRKPILFSLS